MIIKRLLKRHIKLICFYLEELCLLIKDIDYIPMKENNKRIKVNEWIRSCKNIKHGFDEFIDFDLVMRDSNDKNKIKDIYNSGDGVHFNSLGYEKMVEAFTDFTDF